MSACAAPVPDPTNAVVYDACAPTYLLLAPDTSASERAGVSAAIDLWHAAGGPPLSLVPADDTSVHQQVLPVGFQSAAPAFFGLYRPVEGDILINRQLGAPRARAITVAHELGHAFGLAHVAPSVRRSLMNPGNVEVPPAADEARLIFDRSGTCPAAR
jgi:hypothetical protein